MPKTKTILLIEDDEPIIDVYTTALEKADHFKVEAITLGYKAIERIKEIEQGKIKKPDLVLLDLILLDINGLEVLAEMKKYEETKDIPVFILTNYTSWELEQMGCDLKTEKYLTKTDLSINQLVKLVKERLKEPKE